jgi:two-component system chemotaxis response regulator CheY
MARILVVDDNLMMRSVLRLALNRAGHDVTLAAHGAEALSEVERRDPFDLIITDLEMPNLDGRGLVQALRGISCPSPVLLMSGYHGLQELARMAEDSGLRVHGALEKPFTGERLVSMVDTLITRNTAAASPVRRATDSPRRVALEASAPL